MKVALIGYGKMGQTIENIAKNRGHEIVSIIDINNLEDFDSVAFKSADVAIEFTRPDVALSNVRNCFKAGVPVVSGTTGWKAIDLKEEVETKGYTLFWSSNYSLGVNAFFALNKYLAKIMNQFDAYTPSMTETHHVHKLDAPSGTAITLAEGIIENIDRVDGWTLTPELQQGKMPISSIRRHEVPGIHTICYDSEDDFIEITHSARSRRGLAMGAVLAAEFTCGKKGFLGMGDMLKF
ncbi:MAG: 4-hydroxy-tetrahydrodipicolinate reductase [Paludibacteraceae bacterium]|nr:4-hydroxy-tetrahydrodipicolinate reductase [Prevotellaceae bacterium]